MSPKVFYTRDFLTSNPVQHPSCTAEHKLLAHSVHSHTVTVVSLRIIFLPQGTQRIEVYFFLNVWPEPSQEYRFVEAD
jgi:hypothetical protein